MVIPDGYVLIPFWVILITSALALVELIGYIYIFFLRDMIMRKLHPERIKMGTYIEVNGYDFGVKTWNLPPLRVDSLIKRFEENYTEKFTNRYLKLKKDITQTLGEKEANRILKEYIKKNINELPITFFNKKDEKNEK